MSGKQEDLAKKYYDALDLDDYTELEELLSEDFVQYRPDRTLERTRFVEFMQDERPVKDTDHIIDGVYEGPDGAAVVGRVKKDGDRLFGFVDVFRFDDEGTEITSITTYSR